MTTPHTRWMIRRDLPEVLGIERAAFDEPWSEAEFIARLRQRNCIGMVAEVDEHIVGFAMYELYEHMVLLARLAVCPWAVRGGIGTALIDNLKRKLRPERRHTLALDVPERNLPAQLFLQSQGFRATRVLRDSGAYRMEYAIDCGALTT